MASAATDLPEQLAAHLALELGTWPAEAPVTVTTSEARTKPGWDGRVRPFEGVAAPDGAVISVVADAVDQLRDLGPSLDAAKPVIERVLGGRLFAGIFRWSDHVPALEPLGVWIPAADERVPEWLKPFGGDVLVELDDNDRYLAGVGLKRHNDLVWEISVGTEPEVRGKGLARRLVVTAAQRILDDGRIPLYLHAPDNYASAHVADASGFPDLGWKILGLVPVKPSSDRR